MDIYAIGPISKLHAILKLLPVGKIRADILEE